MKRTVFILLSIGALLLCAARNVHSDIFSRSNNTVQSLRGILADIHYGHRTITLQEEFTQLERTFHCPWGRIDHLKTGDEVRVYFRHGRREALSVQKMTPLEYRQKGQNKGYLLRTDGEED
jgi:hypothetical protein